MGALVVAHVDPEAGEEAVARWKLGYTLQWWIELDL